MKIPCCHLPLPISDTANVVDAMSESLGSDLVKADVLQVRPVPKQV